jgi:hypothetical protein
MVHDQTKHGRVPTVYHETLALFLNCKAKSIVAMDVEGFYLARFARSHPDLKMAALFVILDQTLVAMNPYTSWCGVWARPLSLL